MPLGIFYYAWYGGKNNTGSVYRHWKDGGYSPPSSWNSRYLPDVSSTQCNDPSVRLYDSHDQSVVQTQMGLIEKADIDFVIWSWWGQNHFTDHSINKFWNSGFSNTLKHCIYYEKEWLSNVPQSEIIDDINYIKDNYNGSKYFTINGKPVIFVYNATPTGITDPTVYQRDLASKWNAVRHKTGIYTVLKVFNGWNNSANIKKSDSWHQYGPSTAYSKHYPYHSSVSPGWWSPKESTPRLTRDIETFITCITLMAHDGCALHTIQTWNEWTEGTGIEPACMNNDRSYGNVYIDILKKHF